MLDTREVLTERGLSIRALSQKTGIHNQKLSRLLNGQAGARSECLKIADALGVPLDELDLRVSGAGRPAGSTTGAVSSPDSNGPAPLTGMPKILAGLFELLPEPDAEWPATKRAEWLDLAGRLFNLVYKEPPNHDKSTGHDTASVAGGADT